MYMETVKSNLSEIIPDVTFGEVAMFVDNECLSEKGKELKREAIMQADLKARAREKK